MTLPMQSVGASERAARPLAAARRSRHRFVTWHHVVAGVVIGTVGLRILEFVPVLAAIKPLLLITVLAFAAFFVSTAGEVLTLPLRRATSRWMLAFYAWMLLCIPTSVWIGASVGVARGLGLTLAGAWLLLALPDSRVSADRLQRGFAWSGAVFAAMVTVLGGERSEGRFGADIGLDVNDIALVVVVCLPMAMGLALRSRGLGRFVYWGISALMVFTVMRTGSRGGGLALLALLPVMLVGTPWRRSLQFALIALPLATGAWFAAPESFRTRMVSLLQGEEDYNQTDNDGRIAIWKRGISYGVEHPILGVGPGGFITQDGIGKAERGLQGKWSAPHNTYVQVFAEMGVPGFLLFMALIGSVGRLAWRAHRGTPGDPSSRRPEYLAALAAYVVGVTFLSFLFYHMTWILLAGIATMATGATRGAGAPGRVDPSRGGNALLRRQQTPPRARAAAKAVGYAFGRASAR